MWIIQPAARKKKAGKEAGPPDRATEICRALRNAIIEQVLEPGTKLPEIAIGERFGVSRTIVRHAFRQLMAEGLIELRRNQGAVVATPSWEEARDLFEVRIALERLVASSLAGELDAAQIAALKALVKEEEGARNKNDPTSIRLATDFHIVLAEMTGRPALTRYVSEVASRCGLILSLYSRPHSAECAVSEHYALIDALASNDAARAAAEMETHLHAVVGRARISPKPRKGGDIRDLLAPYVDAEKS